MTLSEQQTHIMNRFNFDRVLMAMHALNWTWVGTPVTINRLQSTAMQLMDNVTTAYADNAESGWRSVATGGLEARIDNIAGQPKLILSFIVEHTSGPIEHN